MIPSRPTLSLPIAADSDPILRTIAQPLAPAQIRQAEVQQFLGAMLATLRQRQGVGLAAPQVYRPWRIVMIECDNNPRYPEAESVPLQIWLNPEILAVSAERCGFVEGCLSVANQRGEVWRPTQIAIGGYDPTGEYHTGELSGFAARVIQHEIDHLNGILFTDYGSGCS